MKKALSIILTIFVILSVLSVNVFAAESGLLAGGSLTVGSVAAHPGDTVRIPVAYTDNPGFAASSIKVEFDKDVFTATETAAGTLSGYDITDNFADGLYSANALVNASGDIKGDGILLYIVGKVSANAAPGKYTLTLSSEYGACNWNEDLLLTDYIDGTLTVLCTEHGFSDGVCTVCGAKEGNDGTVTVDNTTQDGKSVFEEKYKNGASDTTVNSAVSDGTDEDPAEENDTPEQEAGKSFFASALGKCIIASAAVLLIAAAAIIIILTKKKK